MFDPIIYTLSEAACLACGLDITLKNQETAIKRMKRYKMTAVYIIGWSTHGPLYPSFVAKRLQRQYPLIYVQYPDMSKKRLYTRLDPYIPLTS
jgi:hypothetical protein